MLSYHISFAVFIMTTFPNDNKYIFIKVFAPIPIQHHITEYIFLSNSIASINLSIYIKNGYIPLF